MTSISTGRLCLFQLLSTLYLIISAAWFLQAIPQLVSNGTDVALIVNFAGTVVLSFIGASLIICVIRKA